MAHTSHANGGPARYCSQCAAPLSERQVGGVNRLACSRCRHVVFPDPKVAVVALVVEKGQVLLVQRRHAPEKGKWVLPGGFLDAGEEPGDVAVREVREETGLEIEGAKLVDLWAEPAVPGGASLVVLYCAERAPGDSGPIVAADDAADAGFFPIDALPPTAFRSTDRALSWWRKRDTPRGA